MPEPEKKPRESQSGRCAPSSTQAPSELEQVLKKSMGKNKDSGSGALNTFLENAPDPVLLFSENGTLIAKNQRAAAFWDGEEAFIPPKLLDAVAKVDARGSPFQEDKKHRLIEINTADGRRYFLPTVFRLCDDETASQNRSWRRIVACILKDETIWERSERIRQNLFASISHELNTPLTSARLSLYLLAEQQVGTLNDNQRDLVERAKQDLDREILSIQNIINMIRSDAIEHQPSRTEDLNLHELIEETVGDFESQIKTMQLPLERDYSSAAPWLAIERDTAQLVMYQLFASILKYSEDGARLKIKTAVENEQCRLELTTINSEQTDFLPDNLFSMEMESPHTRKLRCADLGLRVAHEMVAAYGGSLNSQHFEKSGKLLFCFPFLKR